MDICICMAESLCCPPETTTLLISNTPMQNEVCLFKKITAGLGVGVAMFHQGDSGFLDILLSIQWQSS